MSIRCAPGERELVGLKAMVNTTLRDTRRFIFDHRPMILDDLGLGPVRGVTSKRFADRVQEVGVTIQRQTAGSGSD